ncbi:MAG: S8 family serine peptidase [Verrucomicrobiota bacterium]
MKRLSHGFIGLAALAALVGLLTDWRQDSQQGRAGGGAVSLAAVPRIAPAQKLAGAPEGREVQDRFPKAQVLATQQAEIKTESGETQVRRVRLIRDESFKYPVLRVEDEIIRTPQGERLVRQSVMVGDHVIVKLRNPKMPEAELLRLLGDGGATVRKRMPASGLWLVAFSEPQPDTVPRAISRVSKLKELVLVVEPDHIMTGQATPNDSSYNQLWGMHNTGQSGGTTDADIDAPEAWDIHTGSRSVVVAVIDSGIDQTHPDLVANLWSNPGEIAGNGLDDDGNGYVDDVRGWDWVSDDNVPNDDNGHGTHCAGSIGALGNNSSGVTGVCWQVSLLGLKFLDSGGNGFESDGAEAISYATALGVTMTSNSYTGTTYTQAMKDAIDEAHEAGILFVAASGNNALNVELYPEYPAAYDSANILSVTATTRTEGLALYSNYGATKVDLAAPGHEIYSTLPGGTYGLKNGTSMAAPHVAGACALLKSYKPSLTHMQLRELVMNTVNPLPSLSGKCVTGGRMNLYNAMLASNDILVTPTNHLSAAGPVGGDFTPSAQLLTLTNNSNVSRPWTLSANRSWVTLSSTSGTLTAGASAQITVSINSSANLLLAATHSATITVTSTSTGRVQTRTQSLEVSAAPVFSTSLDTDPGWIRGGEWAYGTPLGQGGLSFGNPDPTSGATGQKVFGVNLAGDYGVANNNPQHLTAGPFSLAGRHGAKLRYQRWLNADFQPWVVTSVEVSTNGSSWNTVWQNNISTPRDSAWTFVEHDLASLTDGQSQMWVRWKHLVTTADAYPQSGWNIDDVELSAVPDKQLRLLLPATMTEGVAPGVASITVAPAPSSNLMISLASDRPGEEVQFPPTVTLLAGQTEVIFSASVTPINDTRIDGTQSVTLTASAATWPSSSATVRVHDNESTNMTVTLPASMTEGGAAISNQARVSLPAAAVVPITINLSSSDVTELVVPVTVTIPKDQTQAFFTLTMPEDTLLDGPQSVTVTATVTGWPAANASTQVLDNESRQLSVSLISPTLESVGTVPGGVVIVPGTLVTPLTVTLVSSDTTELQVPVSVVMAAGTNSKAFDLTMVDDAQVDGDQTVNVSVSAAGFSTGNAGMTVADDERPAVAMTPTPAHLNSPTHPESDLTWSYHPATGGVPQSYDVLFGRAQVPVELIGTVTSPGLMLPRLEPATTYYWQIISRLGAETRAGPVWSFTVPPVGDLHHFSWLNVPEAVARGTGFMSRLTAFDVWGNEIPAFNSPVSLSACTQPPPTMTGTGTYAWFFPLACHYHDARTQSIYTPAEVGPAGRLTSLALDVTKLPGQLLKDFTVRLKHTTRSHYPVTERSWESADWVTVFSGNVTFSVLGWNTISFTTPFDYDGTAQLLVDVSFNNNDYSSDGTVRTSITTQDRTLAARSDSYYGSPLSWSGTTPTGSSYNILPNLRFTRSESTLPMSPATSGTFIHGSWSGNVSVQNVAADVWLKAMLPANPSLMGISSLFDIVAVNDVMLTAEPLYTGGTSNTITWNALGAGYEYELQKATLSSFSDAVSTGFITGTQQGYSSLTDGQTYHYRVRSRSAGLTGAWAEPQRSTQDATPPDLMLTPGSGGVVLVDHLTLQGSGADTSGVSAVSVNGSGVSSADAFGTWTHNISGLADGVSSFTISASDNAVPPNTRSEQWSILHLADPVSDVDGNGVGGLLQYAFHAAGMSGLSVLPQTGVQTDGGTGQRYLTLSYHRLISNPSGVEYHLETSGTLASWQPAGSDAEVLSVVPTGDGVTETVTVRLVPAMTGGGAKFLRVRVVVP